MPKVKRKNARQLEKFLPAIIETVNSITIVANSRNHSIGTV
ncbi:MAG TPA: hypothetical protein PLG03_02470 [Bacteroidales bacterium]|nr:hypothetical protein [Bacteroidales bacterium]HRR49190.1 hypothetical protein [Bacteroidales bacterium]HRT83578.1 hypothetical protein [Bacteroidales bacterium]